MPNSGNGKVGFSHTRIETKMCNKFSIMVYVDDGWTLSVTLTPQACHAKQILRKTRLIQPTRVSNQYKLIKATSES